MGICNPELIAIELVNMRILETIPRENRKTVSVQGRLHKHANFWLNDLDVSSFVRDIVLHGYRLPFTVLPWPVLTIVQLCSMTNLQPLLLLSSLRVGALYNLMSAHLYAVPAFLLFPPQNFWAR